MPQEYVNNKLKFQGFSANIYFFMMIVVLYFSKEFIVMGVYVFFGLLYFYSDCSLYKLLYKISGKGEVFVLLSSILFVLNGVFSYLSFSLELNSFKIFTYLLLVTSLWFNIFYAKKVYYEYKSSIDEYYKEKVEKSLI